MNDLNFPAILVANASALQILLFALVTAILWLFELFLIKTPIQQKWQHSLINGFLILFALPVQLLSNFFMTASINWEAAHHWGLVRLLPQAANPWIECGVMFLVMDLVEYIYHACAHKVPWLWNFHKVHHTDRMMDVSTTLREHPAETLLRNFFLIGVVFVCGASFGVLMLRQTVQTFSNILQHTSFKLPAHLDKILGWLFITPNLHHIHHHYKQPFTNKNYGDVFSFWDRLFGSFVRIAPETVIIGLDTHMDQTDTDFIGVIAMPFKEVGPELPAL